MLNILIFFSFLNNHKCFLCFVGLFERDHIDFMFSTAIESIGSCPNPSCSHIDYAPIAQEFESADHLFQLYEDYYKGKWPDNIWVAEMIVHIIHEYSDINDIFLFVQGCLKYLNIDIENAVFVPIQATLDDGVTKRMVWKLLTKDLAVHNNHLTYLYVHPFITVWYTNKQF